jgi:hypothetical protein
VITAYSTLPRLSAPRHTGEASTRSMTPPWMSSMNAMPVHPAEDTASMTTTPGVR